MGEALPDGIHGMGTPSPQPGSNMILPTQNFMASHLSGGNIHSENYVFSPDIPSGKQAPHILHTKNQLIYDQEGDLLLEHLALSKESGHATKGASTQPQNSRKIENQPGVKNLNDLIAEFNQNYDFSDKLSDLSGTASMNGLNALKKQQTGEDDIKYLKTIQVEEPSQVYSSEEGEIYGGMSSGRNENLDIQNQFKKLSDDKKTGTLTSCADTNFSTSKKHLATYEELKNKYLNFGLPDDGKGDGHQEHNIDDMNPKIGKFQNN